MRIFVASCESGYSFETDEDRAKRGWWKEILPDDTFFVSRVDYGGVTRRNQVVGIGMSMYVWVTEDNTQPTYEALRAEVIKSGYASIIQGKWVEYTREEYEQSASFMYSPKEK